MATFDGKPITLDSNDGKYYYTNTVEHGAEALGTKDEVEGMPGFIAAPAAAPPADTVGGRKRRGKKSRKSRKGKKPRKGKKSRKNKRRTKRR